jgi:DNA polymerase sigma
MVSGVQRWNARMETVDEGYAAWNMSDFPALGQEISSPNANTAKGRALPTHSQCIATHSDTVRSDPEDTPSHRDERGQSDDMREIARILAEMEATEETRAKHREFIARLEGIVKWWCGREARLDPFGSTVAGFATKESDLDLTLNPCRDKAYTGEEKRELLKNLSKHFRFRCHLKSFAVLSARVPVIQLTDPATGVRTTIHPTPNHVLFSAL